MKRTELIIGIALLACLGFGSAPGGQTAKKAGGLPERYRTWLDEEVVYIITPKEKEVFLELTTDRERERFIEAFWRQRDPDPNTPENEFQKEHYRRIAYADQNFGRDTPGPGWRTPMGQVYITLGMPNQIERYENTTELRPTILWFYDGMAKLGLPNTFYVVFFKKDGVGEWVLYSPVSNGPKELMVDSYADPTDTYAAYKQLMAIEPSVAGVSLSLIPSESGQITQPSIASEILIQAQIPSVPREKVKDIYADKFLKYKDSVGVEYTANYVDNDFAVHVFRDPSGIAFVHYLIEPSKLSFERRGDRYTTTLQINLLVSDDRGRAVHQGERLLPMEFSGEQMENLKTKLFSFQDLFPLIEGSYNLSVLVKNAASKDFTSAEAKITVTPPGGPEVGPLVLANRTVENSSYQGKSKPYLFGARQFVLSPRADFARSDTLYLFCQALGLGQSLRRSGVLRIAVSDDKQVVFETRRSLAETAGLPDVFETIPLASLAPALYTARVEVLDQAGATVASREAGFYVSHAETLPRPFVVSYPLPPPGDPVYDNMIGNQYLASGALPEAGRWLAKAFKASPGSSKLALDYCKWLLTTKDFAGLRAIAEPLLKDKARHEFSGLLGQAAEAQGDPGAAVIFYQDYLAAYGSNINVMNSLGDCCLKLGRTDEALAVWKRSLEISPGQDRIRKLVESLEKR